jgi:hypothetical protein
MRGEGVKGEGCGNFLGNKIREMGRGKKQNQDGAEAPIKDEIRLDWFGLGNP